MTEQELKILNEAREKVSKIENPFDGMQIEIAVPIDELSLINIMPDLSVRRDCIATFVYNCGKWQLTDMYKI